MTTPARPPAPVRADVALVERGLATSRTTARRLIEAGRVRSGGAVVDRPSRPIGAEDPLDVAPAPGGARDYVSRAALKLVGALDALAATPLGAPSLAGRRVLDAGASTGGFTQVALERGAAHVVAVDVGHDQLAAVLRDDPRVTSLEGVNVRDLDPAQVAPAPDVLVTDLSFISLTLVLAPLARALAPRADAVVLVKPQFEVGRAALGKGGVVDDDGARAAALARVLHAAGAAGFDVRAVLPSTVAGEHGNRELLAWLRLADGPSSAAAPPVGTTGPAAADCRLTEAAAAAAAGETVLLASGEPGSPAASGDPLGALSTDLGPACRCRVGEWGT
ncbi:23S rRNA (cytidine1920-2'-O)/16S rRNA (cytidine1409-2'-O)-methyltransferase [Salana multivorans]|uniref:23S rRNA (Cytidine1920-2'-O)/16S rRNA (Cytidine1409-2'-O)-methyltransferase n=1 Tax=Salana multivorans TaxID=120377 RepID=A0A3N2D201_9MICO|nr:TlyA family RNA methyltransferase [Salana multivorans]ROR93781.1 23S rRNA (cytidine1920-2'-O)/16S rRNA (cytidine1409-2'-O)-methyltransferase [Salana multivorans]